MENGIILHCDGGSRPNPGFGGWGVHGYMYRNEHPKKSSGNQTHLLTTRGYVPKIDAIIANADGERRKTPRIIEVTPIHYIDGFGSFDEAISNNVAELSAAINGLVHASNYDVKEIQIYTDSEYVRKGLESWVDGWKRNGWLKQDGTEPANISYWKQLIDIRDLLISRGIGIKIDWVKAHSEILGNEMADTLATIGVFASRAREIKNSFEITAAEGYWKYSASRHPFLFHRRLYFNTTSEYLRPGEYFLGDHGKDDELFGNRISDGALAVVMLDKPDYVLEMLRNYQSKIARNADSLVMARLEQVYNANTHQNLIKYGTLSIEQPNPNRLDLIDLDQEPLTREFRPPKLAMRGVDELNSLADKLDLYILKDESLTITNITDILYTSTVKVDKKGVATLLMKLKPEYNVGFAAFSTDANYITSEGIKSIPITLTLGIDLLDRNALKRLDEMNPVVNIVTWNEAPNIFRYATVIETEKDKGIFAGVYSNLRIIPN